MTLDQRLQLIEQFPILLAHGLHQIRKVKGSELGPQELPHIVHHRSTVQFHGAIARRIAKRSSVGHAVEKALLEQTIHRRHDRGIGLPEFRCLAHFANRRCAQQPNRIEHLLLQRAEREGLRFPKICGSVHKLSSTTQNNLKTITLSAHSAKVWYAFSLSAFRIAARWLRQPMNSRRFLRSMAIAVGVWHGANGHLLSPLRLCESNATTIFCSSRLTKTVPLPSAAANS